MALYCQVATSQSIAGSCIGNFILPNLTYIVIPDGQDLEFRRIDQESGGVFTPFRQQLMANGTIIGLKRIPHLQTSAWSSKSKVNTGSDILLIHARSSTETGKVKDALLFKQFDSSTSEFIDLGSQSYEILQPCVDQEVSAYLSVCTTPGVFFGTVIYSNSSQSVYFIDPLDPINQTSFRLTDHRQHTPARAFWVNERTVAMVQETKHIGHTTFLSLDIPKNRKFGKPGVSVKQINVQVEPSSQRVLHVGPIKSNNGGRVLMLYKNMATIIDYLGKKPSEKKAFGLNLAPGTTAFYTLLADNTQSVFLSSSRELFRYDVSKQELQQIATDYVAHDTLIEEISPNFYKRVKKNTCRDEIAIYKIDARGKLQETIIEDVKFNDWDHLQWLYHDFGITSGSTFLSHNSPYIGHTNLVKSQRCDDPSMCNIESALKGITKGVWLINESPLQIIQSTSDQCCVMELNQEEWTQIRIPGIQEDEPVIAATIGIQVTPTNVLYYSLGKTSKIPFDGAIAASAEPNMVAVANTQQVCVFINNGELHELMQFEDPIIAIECNKSLLAILTPSVVHIYELRDTSLVAIKDVQLPSMGYSIAITNESLLVLGLNDGNLFLWPSEKVIPFTDNPVQHVRTQHNGDFSCIGSGREEVALFDKRISLSKRAVITGCEDIIDIPSSDSSVAIVNGALKSMQWSESPSQTFNEVVFPSIKSFDTVKVDGGMIFWIDSNLRCIYTIPVKASMSNVTSVAFPELPGPDYEREFYLTEHNMVIEVARYQKPSSDNSNDDDHDDDDENDFWDEDDDDDDFNVQIMVRLYKLAITKGVLTGVEQVAENQITMEGDAFEAVVVKFFAPLKFTLFSYSSDCVTCSIEKNSANESYSILFGKPQHTSDNVYDDHWLCSSSSDLVTVVEFTGRIFNVHSEEFKNRPYPLSNSPTVITPDQNTMVFDVKKVKQVSNTTTRYCALLKNTDHVGETSILVFDFNGTDIEKRASIAFAGQCMLLGYNTAAADFTEKIAGALENPYTKDIIPGVLLGTTRGSLYSVSTIENEELLGALTSVQHELLKQMGFAKSTLSLQSTSNLEVINGSLLLDALKSDTLYELFHDHGLDHEKLRASLEQITV